VEALGDALELSSPLLERLLVDRLAVPEQEVEDDEVGRDLCGQLAHARLRRVQAHLHGVEVEHTVACDHDLAVQGGVGRQEVTERSQLREVAKQGPAVARPERKLVAVVLQHAPETVPFRLELPAVRLWKLLDELCFHRRKGHVGSGHRAKPYWRRQVRGTVPRTCRFGSVQPGSEEALDLLAAARPFEPAFDGFVLDDDERRHGLDSETLEQIRVLLLGDPHHVERSVVAPPLEHLREETFDPPAVPRQRRVEEDEPG